MTSMAHRSRVFTGIGVAAALVALAGCSGPGGSQPSASTLAVSTEIGPDPTSISVRVNADQEEMWKTLVAGFEADYPSVDVDLQTEAFDTLQQNAPRYLASDDVPDLLRLAAPGDTVADGLLLNLDPYAQAWGWDEFPPSQLEQWTIAENGRTKGTGSLYAMGAGYGLVGLYYDEAKLASLGVEVPTTLDEFEDALAAAKRAGHVGLVGDVTYLFQGLMQSYGAVDQVRDWVNGVEGATIEGPEATRAAETVQEWTAAGYLGPDAATTDAGTALGQFLGGEGVFFAQGSWFASAIDQAGGAHGFMVLPTEADAALVTMSASNAMVIPTNAEHPNEAAAFLDWIQRDAGRKVIVELGGLAPGGEGELDFSALSDRPVFAATLDTFAEVNAAGGIVDFLANATASMASSTLIPQTQLLVAGKITPEEFVAALQEDYEGAQS